MVTTYSYNKLNRLTDEVVKNANGTLLASYSYTLDNAGNRTGVSETQLLPNGTVNTRTVVYQYDNLYRLTSETITGDRQGGNGTVTYTYSLTGNRMSRTSSVAGVSTVTDTYNANDELTSEVSGGVTTSYTYDSNGNTIESVTGNQSPVTFVYDSQNHLVKQDAGQSNEIDIVYDGQGNKVAETVNGVTTKYLIDSNNSTGYSQVVEEIVNGAVTRRYTLGHWIISETQNISGTWATSFYGYDGHNSVRFLTNTSGTVTDNYTFDAFGIKIAGAGTTPNQILYSGEYLDLGTGNYGLRARVYDENTGTFLTADTTPGQLPYVYTSSNPVMFADPSGRFGIMSTLSAISLTSFLAGSVGAAFGGAEHGLRGVEAGFLGGFAGTAITLGSFATIEFVAPWLAPVAAPIAFGLGGFVDTLVQDVTLGGLKALDERSTWEGAIASFVVSGAFGWAGGATLYYINREVAADFAALPSVWNVLGKIQNNSFAAVYPSVLETGLQQTLGTMFRFYMPELFALGRDLVMDEAGSGFRNTAIVPIAQFLVNFAYVSFEGQPPTGSTVSG